MRRYPRARCVDALGARLWRGGAGQGGDRGGFDGDGRGIVAVDAAGAGAAITGATAGGQHRAAGKRGTLSSEFRAVSGADAYS